jgi:hypothetical protein
MDNMTALPEKLGTLLESSRDYLESKMELEILKGTDKIAQGMSIFTSFLLGVGTAIIIILLISFGFAIMINQALGSLYAGYFIMSGVIVLLLIAIFTWGRKSIKKAVINTILKNIDND